MPSTQDVATNHEYRSLPIATLVESPTNPRKRFDERTLAELAASFKTQGVLEPLLVRPLEERKYEVVVVARRLKAARLAELESVPVRVVKLTDAEAIEAILSKNLSALNLCCIWENPPTAWPASQPVRERAKPTCRAAQTGGPGSEGG